MSIQVNHRLDPRVDMTTVTGNTLNRKKTTSMNPEEDRATLWIIALALVFFCPPAGIGMGIYLVIKKS